jgi:hypothetical protein
MAPRQGKAVTAGARAVRARIADWRRTREKRSPMPAALWGDAVALARREGTFGVARAVGVDFESLARRVAEARAGTAGEEPAAAGAGPTASGFVEVSGAQLLGVSGAAGAVVEVADGDGARLTIRLATATALDVAGVVAGFRGRRA